MPIQSPLGGLRTPETGLPAFCRSAWSCSGTGRPPSTAPPSAPRPTPSSTRWSGGALPARTEHTFGRGDVLAIRAPNSPAWPVSALGAQPAGGAVTPLDTACTAEETAPRLRSSGALPESDAPVPDVRIDPVSDPALLLWSSGTTGLSTAVRLTHRSLVSSTVQPLALLRLAAEDGVVVEAVPRTPSRTVLRHVLRRRVTASAPLHFGGPDGGDVLQHELPR